MPITLVIDTGVDIVGIYSVENSAFAAYRGSAMRTDALSRLVAADEVVTYNGNHRDLVDLGKIAGLPGGQHLRLNGIHTDMREVCWSTRIWGSNLTDTYFLHFPDLPRFADTYEGSNEQDVYMTYKLWQLWKLGQLKFQDGQLRHGAT